MNDAPALIEENWRPCSVSLSFRLGELGLFARTLNGFAWRRHFTQGDPGAAAPNPLATGAPTAQFYFLPCYPVLEAPPVIERRDGWVVYTPYVFENHYVDIARIGSFDAYLAEFSSKSRSTLLKKVRKFQEANQGKLDWKVYREPGDMDTFFALAGPLSATTYQARLLDSGLPTDAAFIAEAKRRAAGGEALGFMLFLEEKVVAYVFCFRTDGIVTYDYVGFDASRAELSPGTVLQYLILKYLFEEARSTIFDFTEGEGGHKKLFGRSSMKCAKSYVLRDSIGHRLLVRSHEALNSRVESVGRWLDHLGLKAKVRAMIRRGA